MLNGENIEIEAKFGKLYTLKGEKLIYPDLERNLLPLIYNPQPNFRFNAEIPQQRFHHLRRMVLNGRCDNYKKFHYEPEIKFIKTHTIDEMYTTSDPNVNVRVTKSLDGEVLACISKQDAISMFYRSVVWIDSCWFLSCAGIKDLCVLDLWCFNQFLLIRY